MNYAKRKQQLIAHFQQIEQQINRLFAAREQIRGRLSEIQDLEKEEQINRKKSQKSNKKK